MGYIQIAIVVAALALAGGAVYSYNSALKESERVKLENSALTQAVEEAKQAVEAIKRQSVKNERISAIQITESDRIEAKEPAVVQIIRTVKDETNCADTRAPDDIIRVLNEADR